MHIQGQIMNMSELEKELDHGNDTAWADCKNLDQKMQRLEVINKNLESIHRKSVAIPQLLTAWEKLQEKFKTAVQICSNIEGSKNGSIIATSHQVSHF